MRNVYKKSGNNKTLIINFVLNMYWKLWQPVFF